MEERGEVCLAEEAARMWRSGMSVEEISRRMGVDPTWVGTVLESEEEAERRGPGKA